MTRVLVSGGTGYAGRFIVEHLLANGYKVTVGGRTPPTAGSFSRDVAFVPLHLDPDIDQIDVFENIYYFVHAAFAHVPGKYRGGEGDDPHGFRRANLDGSVRLFEAAKDAGVLFYTLEHDLTKDAALVLKEGNAYLSARLAKLLAR